MKYTKDDFDKRNAEDQQSLTDALSWASYRYYVENDPPMSDYEFDMEYKKLQEMERKSGIIYPNSPTRRVGSDLQSEREKSGSFLLDGMIQEETDDAQGVFKKVRHIIPMQSIDNVYSNEELRTWILETTEKLRNEFLFDEITFTYEPKYDGVSISLVYERGILTDAITRGNQEIGESVFENAKTVWGIPLEIDREVCPELPDYFEVRGEILMPQGAFERLNKKNQAEGKRPFANKRNAASGSLKLKKAGETAKRGLIMNAYAAYTLDEAFQRKKMSSQVETLRLLKTLGFSFYNVDRAFSDIGELEKEIATFNQIRTAKKLAYDCDGVVVKVNERRHQEFLGLNTIYPNWCKARKFPQESHSALVRGVVFQVGMTGRVVPVAELEPTAVGGTIVSRATLNNESYIRELGIAIGGYVTIERAGEVIPKVTGVDEERNRLEGVELKVIEYPKRCPGCNSELKREGEFYVCPNHDCEEQVAARLEYWCGKECADIKGIGASNIRKLMEKEIDALVDIQKVKTTSVRSVSDLYAMFVKEDTDFQRSVIGKKFVGEYSKNTKFGKTLESIYDDVKKSIQTLTLERMIAGLGIDGVGKIMGRDLAAHFKTLEAFRMAKEEDLILIPNVGKVTARNIAAFWGNLEEEKTEERHFEDYACLFDSEYGFRTTYQEVEKESTKLEGLTVLFTGSSVRFTRAETKAYFERNGAKYAGSVTKKVNYVIVGSDPGKQKLEKAAEIGVEVLSEKEFYEKFGL